VLAAIRWRSPEPTLERRSMGAVALPIEPPVKLFKVRLSGLELPEGGVDRGFTVVLANSNFSSIADASRHTFSGAAAVGRLRCHG
jgi:hypothetical protein